MTDIEYLNKYLPKEKIKEGLERLTKGEPVQYIVGNVDFYGNMFEVNKNVLIPRFETEELVSQTLQYINKYFKEELDILDIGTGSGCIAITLNKKLAKTKIDAVDISEKALEVAKKNNTLNNTNVNFFKSDIFSNVTKKYDIIISNPPYIEENEKIMDIVKNNEPSLALYGGIDGLDVYREIFKEAKKYLKKRSIIALEIGSKQGEKITQLANTYFNESRVIIKNDYNNLNRYAFIFNEIEE